MINIQGQVVNQRQQTPGGESVANPWIPLLDILVENIDITWRSPIVVYSILYHKGMS